eukprot:CAMPEP_0172494190 /NCGR_PEP_ID=MMETSP1066-20121228/39669_1 /TAXON_ID=671091 /ORGANISM="Coscinodiscus wailesii, Strain CCMP2513" /LENGTH=424 /DNA_ID=CAMNT_0013264939 /DNA_START=171 /DNA_END=1445 /DNA_ORIENTATION=-
MSQIMDRSKVPVRMTYRAVGSGTGIDEFVGEDNNFAPYNDFGSGDIPMPSLDYANLKDNGIEMLHLPFVLGAISVFHSIPGVGDGELKLTGCTLAKIFKRSIKYWDDEEILELNPGLDKVLPNADYPINVARRVKGSSSTASVTQYLKEACPEEWPDDLVGKLIDWESDTMKCEGSGGMTSCIVDNPGTIGYIDSGHGHSQGLIEIDLENKDGKYLTSKVSAEKGGIGNAAAAIPDRADADFGNVDLLNKPGEWTWPIVAMSYVYVRKDLSHITDDQEKTLLKYFLESLYDPDVISQCEDNFGFVRVPESVKTIAMNGLKTLDVGSGTPWTTETNTMVGTGMGYYVISAKRRTYAELTYSSFADDLNSMEEQAPTTMMSGSTASYQSPEKQAMQIQSALIMGGISIALWSVAIGFFLAKNILGV